MLICQKRGRLKVQLFKYVKCSHADTRQALSKVLETQLQALAKDLKHNSSTCKGLQAQFKYLQRA